MLMSIIDLYSAKSRSISTVLCVLSGNRFVFSSYLKLLLLSTGSRRLSGSEFKTVGPTTEET